MFSAIISDDRELVRDSLAHFLSSVAGLPRIWRVDYEQLVAAYSRHRAAVVFIGTGDATQQCVRAVRALITMHAGAAIVAVGGSSDTDQFAAMIDAGAAGCLQWPLPAPPADTPTAPDAGGTAMVRGIEEGARFADPVTLTDREMQVLEGMSRGLTNADIGRQLYLTEDTIKTHARRLFRKLGVTDRAEAVAHGFRRALIN